MLGSRDLDFRASTCISVVAASGLACCSFLCPQHAQPGCGGPLKERYQLYRPGMAASERATRPASLTFDRRRRGIVQVIQRPSTFSQAALDCLLRSSACWRAVLLFADTDSASLIAASSSDESTACRTTPSDNAHRFTLQWIRCNEICCANCTTKLGSASLLAVS